MRGKGGIFKEKRQLTVGTWLFKVI